ncbi:phage head closure protein [Sphingomonas sp. BAUL-RG-20F-R05-02]|uniref:phage head closure protein n=1 Tax=Sphingomonas sp. BAUL-RG-20F-R05-02 TaxID=2914830 RepID=UPI001F5A5980|nr:phage head closure protein [Sphingomonas sp. BAUL-RG-20F-R05-02]
MSIAAGRLRERVTIQEPNVVDNGRGGRKTPEGESKWRDVSTNVRAEIIPLRGDEALSLGVQRATQLYRVTIRKRRGITPANRLLWGEIALDIRAAPPSTDGISIVMTCESGKAG